MSGHVRTVGSPQHEVSQGCFTFVRTRSADPQGTWALSRKTVSRELQLSAGPCARKPFRGKRLAHGSGAAALVIAAGLLYASWFGGMASSSRAGERGSDVPT